MMKRLSYKNMKRFAKKCPSLFMDYFDCIVIIILLLHLKQYFIYYKVIMPPSNTKSSSLWWKWPVYEGWSIRGKVPIYDDHENTFDVTKTRYSLPHYAKYAPRSNQAAGKLILFEHVPIEDVPRSIDPNLCGGKCTIAFDDETKWNKADAVVFSLNFPDLLPKRSFPSQLYVWMLQENPSTTLYSVSRDIKTPYFDQYKSDFNMTMNYRRDADIYFPYNTSYNVYATLQKTSKIAKPSELLLEKTKLSAWASSNCGYTKGGAFRMRMMLKMLNAGLEVDIFGTCFHKVLAGHWIKMPEYLKPYKFFFSFENAFHCRDYMTEKVWWNALSSGIVPVIWGPMRQDVDALLPAGSFIFVEDFKTEQELVDYLKYLDQNDEKYLKYFEWRFKEPEIHIAGRKDEGKPWVTPKVTGLCQLCHMLYDDDKHERIYGIRPQRIVDSVYKWWYLMETKTCLSPNPYLESVFQYSYRWLLTTEIWFGTVTHMRLYTFICCVIILVLTVRRLKLL